MITIHDDKKEKYQSVTASADFEHFGPMSEHSIHVSAYGSTEQEAKQNLILELETSIAKLSEALASVKAPVVEETVKFRAYRISDDYGDCDVWVPDMSRMPCNSLSISHKDFTVPKKHVK